MNAEDILQRYNALRQVRDGTYIHLWDEVRRYVYPSYNRHTEGDERGMELFDTTAVEARQRLAAGMYNWMAPPDQRWFELMAESDELAKDDEVKEYFAQVTKEISLAIANSNWPTVLIETLNNMACGFDGVVYCEDRSGVLNFRSFPIETVCYAENSQGKVDTLFRELNLTTRQMVQEFGESVLPDEIRSAAGDPKKSYEKHQIIHCIMPRSDRDVTLEDARNMPFADFYIEPKSKKILKESGYEEFPFAVCRFEKSDNEIYGRGPGINKLPDIKMLNRMRQVYIVARERQADPSYIAPDGSVQTFNRDPGSVIFYKSDLGNGKPEQLPFNTNLESLYRDIEAEREKIKLGFFWDMFDPLGDLKQITATEAEIRNEGKMVPFAPIAGNLHNELFRVIIHRVYAIMLRNNLLPALPEKLAENPDYKVEFVSKIARSIKKTEVIAWLQTEASLGNIASMKPDVMDNFNLDDIVRTMALTNGVDPKMLQDVKDRDSARQIRSQQAAQMQAAETLMGGASALGSNLAKAPEEGSPMDAILSGEGV